MRQVCSRMGMALAGAAALLLLVAGGAQAGAAPKVYSTKCAMCHGANGGGDGPMAKVLKKKPTNFTDPVWIKGKSDADITRTIKEGGKAVGLDASMPAFKTLSDADVQALVTYLKGLAGSANK